MGVKSQRLRRLLERDQENNKDRDEKILIYRRKIEKYLNKRAYHSEHKTDITGGVSY